MSAHLASILVLLTLTASAPAAPASLADMRAMVAGLAAGERVIAAAMPLASGSWGTDYLTVSHALRVGKGNTLTIDGRSFAETERIAACSSQYHGIDLLIVRVRGYPGRSVLTWAIPPNSEGEMNCSSCPAQRSIQTR